MKYAASCDKFGFPAEQSKLGDKNAVPGRMNIYPGNGIGREFARDSRAHDVVSERPPPRGFPPVGPPPLTFRGHPQPPFRDYFLLICITGAAVDKRSERPAARHCDVNKLRLPDLLPRGGHASSFVIAAPLSPV